MIKRYFKPIHWGIRAKMSAALGSIFLLLVLTGLLAYMGIDTLVGNTRKMIENDALRVALLQRETEHQAWAAKLSDFVHQHSTTLEMELDHRQCGFGQWYYSEQRGHAEARVPALAEGLAQIEAPHKALHESARAVQTLAREADSFAVVAADARLIFHNQTQPLLAEMQSLLNQLVARVGEFSVSEDAGLLRHAARIQWFMLLGTLAGLVIAGFGMFYVLRGLMRQLGGEPVEIMRIAGLVAKGRLDIAFQAGRRDTGIYAAIRSMVESLQTVGREREQQNWIKTGQTRLSECSGGDQDIISLAENIINFLTPYVDAQVGAFYVLENGDNPSAAQLRMLASHAFTWHGNIPTRYKLGDGMVGQAGLERKPIVVTEAPEDYIRIESGLGEALPRAILTVPFLLENRLKGVMEFATLHEFTPVHLEFLEQVMPAVAIAVNTAESRTRLRELLEQSQSQTGELGQQTKQLQAQRTEMQRANEVLQSQSEELQVQQEELRQTNDALEQRTHDLEEQQAEIARKNRELEKTKREIEIKAQELSLASQYKSEFLANMSHELRTPLNSLLILAQLLATNKEGNLTEKQVDCARTIHTSGSDLLTLINEVLDLSKVEAGKLELHREDVEVADLTASMTQKFQHMAEKKGVRLEIHTSADFPSEIHTDSQRLKQVINNLLSNALKFTEQGSVQLILRRAEAEADLFRSGLDPRHTLVIEVKDSGIGISPDKQKVIFEAFQQADGTTSRKYGGTGLGLSISRQLVQLMGGEIQLISEEGQGSAFSVYLPEAVTAAEEKSPPPLAEKEEKKTVLEAAGTPLGNQADKADVSGGKSEEAPKTREPRMPPSLPDDRDQLTDGDKVLLIIEDDETFAKTLVDLAHEKGFKCLHAGDGRNALLVAEHFKPHAIVLDVGLPLVDGWTVLEHLKEDTETRHIPIHMMSGYDHGADAKRMGALGYSLKPVSMHAVAEAFKHIERVISTTLRKPLVLTDNPRRQAAIQELLGSEDIKLNFVTSGREAENQLVLNTFDCLVVDVEVEQGQGVTFLEKWHRHERATQVPVILYAERELSDAEEKRLKQCEENVTVKTVKTPERLLDEATLFLHQVESKLPQAKRDMLRRVHDKDTLFNGRKILLVDDDVRNTFALATALESRRMEVFIAKNGRHGLQLLEQTPGIDLVLMDIMMPEMDGYEAMQKIRTQAKWKKLPIIALTAKAMKNDKAKCIEAGASDYLAKPVDMDKLLSLMRVWLYR